MFNESIESFWVTVTGIKLYFINAISFILKRSLVRLIKHKSKKQNCQYDFEINIFFDDAFQEKNNNITTNKQNDNKIKVLNSYVNSFLIIFEKVLTNNQLETQAHSQSGRFRSRLHSMDWTIFFVSPSRFGSVRSSGPYLTKLKP